MRFPWLLLLSVLLVAYDGVEQRKDYRITTYGGLTNNAAVIQKRIGKVSSIPENEANYPAVSMFGELPSWGFYRRPTEGIQFKNMPLWYIDDDFRPALVFDDVKSVVLSNVCIPTAKELPVIQLNNTSNLTAQNLKLPVDEAKGIVKTNYN